MLQHNLSGTDSTPSRMCFISNHHKIIIFICHSSYAPLGIASLITGAILEIDSLPEAGRSMGMTILCVFLGCVILQLFTELLLFIIIRRNPFWYHYNFLEGILAATAPSSR